jgi:N-acetylmuramoyl-L-alanine amidase
MRVKFWGTILLSFYLLLLSPSIIFAEKILVIDPGHGGKFTGTCGFSGNKTGFCEKDANLSVALKLRDYLKNSDIKVYLTRDKDKEFAPYLKKADGSTKGGDFDVRMKIANEYAKGNNDNSIFISIHHNAHPSNPHVKGYETYYYDGVNHYNPQYPPDPMQIGYLNDSKRLAELIHPTVLQRLSLIDRGIHNDESFYVIRNAQMPAVLVEMGYMTNPEEEKRIKSISYQQNAAQALATAVINYFKVFEVYDLSNKKLATFKTKNEAINFANKQTKTVKVFDKDKQQFVYTNGHYEVYHRTNGYMAEFYSEKEAILYASKIPNTRVISKSFGWTTWSNYLKVKYDVYIDGKLGNRFVDFDYAQYYAKKYKNTKIVNNITNEVLWTDIKDVKVTRFIHLSKLAGENRYITSVKISQDMYPNGFPDTKRQKVVILTTGYEAADALSAGPLSKIYDNAPILLTPKEKLDLEVKDEIIRLGTKKVIIIGGVNAISGNVENEILSLGIQTERISGKDRYETNKLILSKLGSVNGVFVVSGKSFPDALAAAPIAASKGWGILLTPKDELPSNISSFIQNKPVVVVGGQAVISEKVINQLKTSYHAKSVTRLAGKDRYETLAKLLWHYKQDLTSNTIHLSTGTNFPDALAAAPLSIQTNAPLILVNDQLNKNVESFVMEFATENHIEEIKVIGGVVSDSLIRNFVNNLR